MRDFSGVQYYFHNQVRIGKGHLYFPDAEWGLSSISQLAYWRERMSPTGPFLGQLSVDIGNFYALAPARDSHRFGRPAWQSTYREIVAEVWEQVRMGVERERAGVLIPPDYVHIDEGLRFDHPRGSVIRESATIVVKRVKNASPYTIRINGEPFSDSGDGSTEEIATRLRDAIRQVPFGSTQAEVHPNVVSLEIRPEAIVHRKEAAAIKMIGQASLHDLDLMEAAEREHPAIPGGRDHVKSAIDDRRLALSRVSKDKVDPNAEYSIRVRSTAPVGAALVFVTGSDPGSYELAVGDTSFRYAALPYPEPDAPREETCQAESDPSEAARRTMIRDGLFAQFVGHLKNLPVSAALSGKTGLLLTPTGTDKLPAMLVRNDHQNLQLVFGPMLHIRLEQLDAGLAFDRAETATAATIGYNDTPFLINVPKQWAHRPGVLQPDRLAFEERRNDLALDERVFYRVSNKRWVAAGTYMATTTRLTTMESANESGRHAVNAILNRLLVEPSTYYNSQGRMFADWAETWDPEKYELDDVEPMKRLDERLVADGLPHVLDILKVLDGIDALPMHGQASTDPLASVTQLFQHAANATEQDWGFLKETLQCFITHAAERVQSGLDPLGMLTGSKGLPSDVMERIKNAVQALLNVSGATRAAEGGSNNSDSR